LGGLVHQDDKNFEQLQSADLMASLARETYMKSLENPSNANLERLPDPVHRIDAWTENTMRAVLLEQRRKLWRGA
jgi:hypothetical protein